MLGFKKEIRGVYGASSDAKNRSGGKPPFPGPERFLRHPSAGF